MTDHDRPIPPPGFFIKEELHARGWTQSDLAYLLGCSVQAVNLIVSGKRGVSPEMSKALGAALDVSGEFYANLQKAFDLSQARDPDPGIARRARLQAAYPIREMIRRGWIEDTDDPGVLEIQMARFFEVEILEDIPHLRFAPKKTHYQQIPAPQLAWLFRVRQIAKRIHASPYSESKLPAALPQLRRLLRNAEDARHVSHVLAACGVRFVLVEPLPQGKIDGVCFWIGDSPVIGMSLRYDRIDNFWFVLRHEIEHVLQKHGRDEEMVDAELVGLNAGVSGDLPVVERIANIAAAEFLVPPTQIEDFIAKRDPYFSERDVVDFAHRLEIHPGIVVGQIQSRTGRYDFLHRHLVKIRQFALEDAEFSDGWGRIFPVAISELEGKNPMT
jgi:HTH-type transcriptional regulator/antitoxin HigA